MRSWIASTILVCIAVCAPHFASAANGQERFSDGAAVNQALDGLINAPEGTDLKPLLETLIAKHLPILGPEGQQAQLYAENPILNFYSFIRTTLQPRLAFDSRTIAPERRRAIVDTLTKMYLNQRAEMIGQSNSAYEILMSEVGIRNSVIGSQIAQEIARQKPNVAAEFSFARLTPELFQTKVTRENFAAVLFRVHLFSKMRLLGDYKFNEVQQYELLLILSQRDFQLSEPQIQAELIKRIGEYWKVEKNIAAATARVAQGEGAMSAEWLSKQRAAIEALIGYEYVGREPAPHVPGMAEHLMNFPIQASPATMRIISDAAQTARLEQIATDRSYQSASRGLVPAGPVIDRSAEVRPGRPGLWGKFKRIFFGSKDAGLAMDFASPNVVEAEGPSTWKALGNNQFVEYGVQTAGFMAAMAAFGLSQCVVNMVGVTQTDPACLDRLLTQLDPRMNPGMYFGMGFFIAGLVGANQVMTVNTLKTLPTPLKSMLAIAGAMFVQDIGARGLNYLNACYRKETTKDPIRRQQYDQMCETGFQNMAMGDFMVSVVPGLMSYFAGVGAANWLNGTQLFKGMLAFNPGENVGVITKFRVSAYQGAAMLGVSYLVMGVATPAYTEWSMVGFPLAKMFSFISPFWAWPIHGRKVARDAYDNGIFNPDYTLSPKNSGAVVNTVQRTYLAELKNWMDRGFAPASIEVDAQGNPKCTSRAKFLTGIFSKESDIEVCAYQRPMAQVINDYFISTSSYRDYKLAGFPSMYFSFVQSYLRWHLLYLKTKEVYKLMISDLRANKLATGRAQFSPNFYDRILEITASYDTEIDRALLKKEKAGRPANDNAVAANDNAKSESESQGVSSAHFPQIGQARVRNLAQYLITTAACGVKLKDVNLANDLNNTFTMGAGDFTPFRLTTDKTNFCDAANSIVFEDARERDHSATSNVLHSRWQDRKRVGGRPLRNEEGLMEHIANNVDPMLTSSDSAFQEHWSNNLAVATAEKWKRLRGQYNKALKSQFLPVLNDKGFTTCTANGSTWHNYLHWNMISNQAPSVCASAPYRLAEMGESVREQESRLASGLKIGIRDDMVKFLQTLEVILLAQTPKPLRAIKSRNFRAIETQLLAKFDEMADYVTGGGDFGTTSMQFSALLNRLYSTFGQDRTLNDLLGDEEQVRILAQKLQMEGATMISPYYALDAERVAKKMSIEERVLAEQNLTLATLFARIGDLQNRIVTFYTIVNGVGGMPAQSRRFNSRYGVTVDSHCGY